MQRRPLLFGTPSVPPRQAMGSLGTFTYDGSMFPMLCSSTSTNPYAATSAKPTYASVLGPEQAPKATPSPPIPTVAPTRKDHQFQELCDEIRTNLYESQFTTAKLLLSCIPTTAHDAWLQRLAQAMAGETIMVQAPIASPKPYYKRVFRPHFTDPVPLPATPLITRKPVLHTFTSPRSRHYDIWTDRTLATYADGPHSQDDHLAAIPRETRHRKVCRPSSYARPTSLRPTLEKLPCKKDEAVLLADSSVQRPQSRHTYQFSSYERQHGNYQRFLDQDVTQQETMQFHHATAPQDHKGQSRYRNMHFRKKLDTYLQQKLSTTPATQWVPILTEIELSLLFWSSTTTNSKMQYHHPTSDKEKRDTAAAPSETKPIGLGIAHFPRRHRLRLQRRFQRAQRALAQLCTDYFDFPSALSFEQHGFQTTYLSQLLDDLPSALTFEQHGFLPQPYSPSLIFCVNSMHMILSAPRFWQHESLLQLLFLFLPGMKLTHRFSCPLLLNPASALHFQQHLDSNPILPPPSSFSMDLPRALHLWHYGLPCTYQYLDRSPRPLPVHPCTYSQFFQPSSDYSRLGIQKLLNLGISNPSLFPYGYANSCTDRFSSESPEVLYGCLENPLCIYLGIFKRSLFPHSPLRTFCFYDCDNQEDQLNISEKIHIRGHKNTSEEQTPHGPGRQEPDGQKIHLYDNRTHYVFLPWLSEPPHDFVVASDSHEPQQHYTPCGLCLSAASVDLPQWSCLHVPPRFLRFAVPHTMDDSIAYLLHLCPASLSLPLALAAYEDPAFGDPLFDPLSSSNESIATLSSVVQTGTYEQPESEDSPIQTFFVQYPLADPHPTPSSITPLPSKVIQPLNNLSGLFSSHLYSLFDQYQMDCTVDDSFHDWVLRILSSNNAHGVFHHNDHWYPYVQFRSEIHLVIPSTHNLTLITLLYQLLYTLQSSPPLLYYYQSPPTPHGLCGLSAVHILRWALHSPCADALSLGIDSRGFYWTDQRAISLLFSQHRGLLDFTSKHFIFGPSGFMKSHSTTSSASDNDEPPHPFDFRTVQQPHFEQYPYPLIDVPLSSPDLPQTPITISLYPDDQELAQQDNLTAYLNRFIVYCHIAQTLQFQSFTITPQQSFIHEWQNQFPGYNSSLIDVILVWNSHHSTWVRTDFAEIESTITKARTGTCHLRIVFHSKDIHVAFPLLKRILISPFSLLSPPPKLPHRSPYCLEIAHGVSFLLKMVAFLIIALIYGLLHPTSLPKLRSPMPQELPLLIKEGNHPHKYSFAHAIHGVIPHKHLLNVFRVNVMSLT